MYKIVKMRFYLKALSLFLVNEHFYPCLSHTVPVYKDKDVMYVFRNVNIILIKRSLVS